MTKTKTKSTSLDMLNGKLLPNILLFSLPLAATGILQLLFNAADMIVVGKFAGNNALAAVGSTASLINLLLGVFMGFSVGANIAVARRVGGGHVDLAQRAVHTSLAISAIMGVVLLIVGLLFSAPLLRMMDTPEDILPLASEYLRIYFLGTPAILIYNFGAAILRAVGDTRRPLLYLIIAGVINVILNLVLVIVFHLGVAGVAIATTASQVVSMVLVIRCLMHDDGPCRFSFSNLCIDWGELSTIVQIGIPAGIQAVVTSLSNVLIQSSVNSFGSVVIAANSAAANINNFTYTSMNAVSQAAISFTSQNFAAGNRKRIGKIFGACMLTVSLIGIPMSVIPYIFGEPLLGIFLDQTDPAYADILHYGMVRMFWISVFYFACGYMDTVCGMVRGLGSSWMPTIVSIIGTCAFRVIWIYTIFRAIHTLDCLYTSYLVSWVLTTLIHMGCYLYLMKHRRFPKMREAVS